MFRSNIWLRPNAQVTAPLPAVYIVRGGISTAIGANAFKRTSRYFKPDPLFTGRQGDKEGMEGGSQMKKTLLIGAALALCAMSAAAFVGHAQAAAAQSPFCKLANGEKNPMSWDAYYNCLGSAPQVQHVAVHSRAPATDPYCKMASGEKNLVGWEEFYHCWNR